MRKTIMRPLLAFALLFAVRVAIHAQQLPAGTREADDHSREDAANTRLREAEAALEHGDFKDAARRLKALSAEHPKDAHLLFDLGYAEERIDQNEAAAQAYAQAIEADPGLAEPRVALGLLDARAGRSEKAHRELQAAAALTSAAPDLRARALRALAAMDASTQPEAAREELLAAVKLSGETPDDIQLSAELAAKSGDAAGSEQAYRRALAADPKNAEAAGALARLLERANKDEEAEAVLSEALQGHTGDPALTAQLAAVYAAEGKADQGVALLEQARAADAKLAANDAVTRMLARLYAMANKNEDAARLYEGLAARTPSDPSLLDAYGGVLVKLGRNLEAESTLLKAVSMRQAFSTPEEWGEAAGHLAFAASRNHDPKVVLQALAARATVLPNSAASLFLEATAHDSLRETKDAIKAYREFLGVANGKFPDEEFQARHRLVALEHMK